MIVIDISDIFILIFRRFVRSVKASKSEKNTWSGFPIEALGQSQHTGNLQFIKN